MSGRVILFGVAEPVAPECGIRVSRFSAEALFSDSFGAFAGWNGIVLGADVIATLHPALVRARLGAALERTALYGSKCDASKVIAYLRAGFANSIASDGLASFIRDSANERMMPRLEPASWLGRAPPSERDAVVAIAALDDRTEFGVRAWAESLGWSEGKLLGVCQKYLGMSSRDVSTRHRLALAVELRLRGWLEADIADILGFSDAPTLLRACRRCRVTLPPIRREGSPAT